MVKYLLALGKQVIIFLKTIMKTFTKIALIKSCSLLHEYIFPILLPPLIILQIHLTDRFQWGFWYFSIFFFSSGKIGFSYSILLPCIIHFINRSIIISGMSLCFFLSESTTTYLKCWDPQFLHSQLRKMKFLWRESFISIEKKLNIKRYILKHLARKPKEKRKIIIQNY